MTWILDLAALDPGDSPVTLRYSLGRYDDPDDHAYDPSIDQPGLYKAGLFAGDLLPGSRSGYGETTLINTGGRLDHLVDYAVDGRLLTLRRESEAGLVTVLRGTVSRLAFEQGLVSIKLREPLDPLKTPHPQEAYAGDNALPDGLEGSDDDLGGQPKPKVLGEVANASPPLVNTARLIYQVSSLADCTVTAVYDGGSALTRGADYASLTELQDTAPAAGEYRRYQGYFRLGASPSGTVTADATTAQPNAGDVAARIAADRGWSVHVDDVAALNALGAVRLYLAERTDTLELLDRIAISTGGYLNVDPDGTLRVRRVLAPADPALTLRDHEILDIQRSAAGAGSNGLPVWRVTLNADRIETVQTDLNGNVPDSRRARLAQQARPATAERQATLDRHPLAQEITIDSVLASRSQAQTIAADLVALLGVRRDVVTITARLTALGPLAVGECVSVVTPRLGYGEGRTMLVIGQRFDAQSGELELNLWG